VAPDAQGAGLHGTKVSTATRAQREMAGPLVLPSVGVVAPVVAEMYGTPEPVSRPVPDEKRPNPYGDRGTSQARTEALVAITAPSEQTVTPTTPAVTPTTAATTTETTPTTPLAEPTAATTSSSATTQEQPA
jgi:hypothetical protein